MKRIVYLSFFFKPDLSACSFRNSSLAFELAKQAKLKNIIIDVYTTLPNRYRSIDFKASKFEKNDNLRIHRIKIPKHNNGILDQVLSFIKFYYEVNKLNKGIGADLVFASSSKLFTGFLGYKIASQTNSLLYLDIRDIFVDTINSIFKSNFLKILVSPFLKYVEMKTFNNAHHINLISEGFKDYFKHYRNSKFSYFTNGIDQEFISKNYQKKNVKTKNNKKLIVYAGNIGEGQGLHKIIPYAAKILEDDFEFLIIGDGGTKKLLELELNRLKIKNVVINDPVERNKLKVFYNKADYLFLHLNDYPAFKKVLPSKIFELATYNKPILAGVSGYSAEFIKKEISFSFVFEPCNVKVFVDHLLNYNYVKSFDRKKFIEKFKRRKINKEMASSIISYL